MTKNNPKSQFRLYLRLNCGSLLWFQVGLGILIGSLLQGTNGLDCYACKHSPLNLPTLPENPDCFKPATATGSGVTKVTCTAPDIACMKGYGEGNHGGAEVKILIRKCFIPESGQKEPDGCKDFVGEVYENGDIISDKPRHIMRRDVLDSSANLSTTSKSLGPNTTEGIGMEGKQFIPTHLHMKGRYCWCDGKDFCNDAEGFKVLDPNAPDAPPKDHCHVQKSIPQLVFFFSSITTTVTMTTIHVLAIS